MLPAWVVCSSTTYNKLDTAQMEYLHENINYSDLIAHAQNKVVWMNSEYSE